MTATDIVFLGIVRNFINIKAAYIFPLAPVYKEVRQYLRER